VYKQSVVPVKAGPEAVDKSRGISIIIHHPDHFLRNSVLRGSRYRLMFSVLSSSEVCGKRICITNRIPPFKTAVIKDGVRSLNAGISVSENGNPLGLSRITIAAQTAEVEGKNQSRLAQPLSCTRGSPIPRRLTSYTAPVGTQAPTLPLKREQSRTLPASPPALLLQTPSIRSNNCPLNVKILYSRRKSNYTRPSHTVSTTLSIKRGHSHHSRAMPSAGSLVG
jgi:hypothetical protein